MNQLLPIKITIADTNMSFEKSIVAVQTYKRELAEMQKALREKFITELEQDFYALREEFPGLDKIFVLGCTPEWNDGEECVHESDIYIENQQDERWDEMGLYVDRMYWDEEEVPDDFLHINTALSKEQVSQIKEILRKAKFEDNLETVFETNFNIIVDFTEQDIKVHVEDYDRGY